MPHPKVGFGYMESTGFHLAQVEQRLEETKGTCCPRASKTVAPSAIRLRLEIGESGAATTFGSDAQLSA